VDPTPLDGPAARAIMEQGLNPAFEADEACLAFLAADPVTRIWPAPPSTREALVETYERRLVQLARLGRRLIGADILLDRLKAGPLLYRLGEVKDDVLFFAVFLAEDGSQAISLGVDASGAADPLREG
jgi:hypothetical protein